MTNLYTLLPHLKTSDSDTVLKKSRPIKLRYLKYLGNFNVWEIHLLPGDIKGWIAKKFLQTGMDTGVYIIDNDIGNLRKRIMAHLPYVPDCIDVANKNQPSLVESWF